MLLGFGTTVWGRKVNVCPAATVWLGIGSMKGRPACVGITLAGADVDLEGLRRRGLARGVGGRHGDRRRFARGGERRIDVDHAIGVRVRSAAAVIVIGLMGSDFSLLSTGFCLVSTWAISAAMSCPATSWPKMVCL